MKFIKRWLERRGLTKIAKQYDRLQGVLSGIEGPASYVADRLRISPEAAAMLLHTAEMAGVVVSRERQELYRPLYSLDPAVRTVRLYRVRPIDA